MRRLLINVIGLNKKGMMAFEEVAKLILGLVLLGIIILMIYAFRDKILELLEKLLGIF